MVTELGKGCTKDVVTTGELKRKIEEAKKHNYNPHPNSFFSLESM